MDGVLSSAFYAFMMLFDRLGQSHNFKPSSSETRVVLIIAPKTSIYIYDYYCIMPINPYLVSDQLEISSIKEDCRLKVLLGILRKGAIQPRVIRLTSAESPDVREPQKCPSRRQQVPTHAAMILRNIAIRHGTSASKGISEVS